MWTSSPFKIIIFNSIQQSRTEILRERERERKREKQRDVNVCGVGVGEDVPECSSAARHK
jgi:hypothetical protein